MKKINHKMEVIGAQVFFASLIAFVISGGIDEKSFVNELSAISTIVSLVYILVICVVKPSLPKGERQGL